MALEKIVINVSGQTDLDNTIKKLVELGVIDEKNAKSFQANSKATQKELKNQEASYSGLKDAVGNYVDALPGAQQVQQIANLTKGLQGAATATSGVGRAMNVLKTAFIGLGLGAIVVLLGSIVAYFKKTEEGSDKLAKIMTILGVIGEKVINVFASLGGVVVKVFEKFLDSAVAVYDFLSDTFFSAIEFIADALETLGFDGASESLRKFRNELKQGQDDMEDAIITTIKLGKAIADLADKIEEKTLDIALANDELTTSIEKNLKALRNRTNTYKENNDLIEKISKDEKQRLENSMSLLNDQIALERLQFQKRTNNAAKTNEAFDQFVNKQITASEFLAKLDGDNKQAEVEHLTELLLKRGELNRESLKLEETLQNRKDANLEREKQRLEKERLAREKAAADQIKASEERAKKLAQIEEDFKKLTEKEFQDSTDNLKDHYTERLNVQKQALLNGEITQEQFNAAVEALQLESLENQRVIYEDYGKDVTNIDAQILDQKLKMQKTEVDAFKKAQDEKDKKAKEKDDEQKKRDQLKTEFAINNIREIGNALFASQQTELDNEKHKFDQQAENQIKALERRNELGLISDAQLAAQKEAIAKKQSQKELEFRRRAAQAEKNQALFNIAINTASNAVKAFGTAGPLGVALAIATGAIQASIVGSRPLPEFKKGGFTGEGNVNDTAGIVHKREFVMPAEKTAQYREELEAMYQGKYKQRDPIKIDRSLIDLRGENMAENIYKSILMNGFDDRNIVNAISKNNKIKMGNTDELANKIASKIGDRMSEGRLYA